MFKTVLLLVATVLLFVNIILTILEAFHTYHELYSSTAHPGRIRGASDPISTGPEGEGEGECDTSMSSGKVKGRIKLCGMWYNVEWLIIGKYGVLYYEETDKRK